MVSTLAVGACIAAHEHGLACECFCRDSKSREKHEHGCVHSRCMVRFWGRANRSFFLAPCQVLLFLYKNLNFALLKQIILVLLAIILIPSCVVLGSKTREGVGAVDGFAQACVHWMSVSRKNMRHEHKKLLQDYKYVPRRSSKERLASLLDAYWFA